MNQSRTEKKAAAARATHSSHAGTVQSTTARWKKLFHTKVQQTFGQVSRNIASVKQVHQDRKNPLPEKHSHHFPESNFWPVQLLLVCAAIFPQIFGTIKARLWNLRGKITARWGKVHTRMERFLLKPAYFAMATFVLVFVTIFFSKYSMAVSVSYQGQTLGLIEDAHTVEQACAEIEQTISATTGREYHLPRDDFFVTRGLTSESEYLDLDTLEEKVYQTLNLVTFGYTLKVDGEAVGSTVYEGALEDLLKQHYASYITPNTVSCGFLEEVEVVPGMVPTSSIVNLGTILTRINSTKSGEVTHVVRAGESWYAIAAANNLTTAQLLEKNPGFNINSLHVGDVLTISNAVSYLTVKQVEQESYVQEIPYEIEYQDNASMYQGDYRVLSPGQMGQADVVANVTYSNGEELSREILSSVTLKEPVTELQARGTKPRPSWFPTGKFRWPTTGPISSYFGGRYIFGSYSYHQGIDIVCAYGTPIYASDGGTVVFSGWSGSYGNLVKIDHGNGYVSYYAHNSSLLVKVGDKVYKGQTIAKAGSTGRSTGNHCHFGLTYNGSFINPLTKLP